MTQVATPPVGRTPGAAADAGPPATGLFRLPVGDGPARTRRASLALRLLVPVSIFAAWWILTATNAISPTTLSSPSATWDSFLNLWNHQDLIGDIGVSVRRAIFGLALGAGLGLVLGIVVGLSRLGEEFFDSSMQMLRMIPYPGRDLPLHRVVRDRRDGEGAPDRPGHPVPHVPEHLQRRAQRGPQSGRGRPQFGLQGRQLVRQVVVPLAMPSILTGLRFAAGISVIALVFAETISANQGIGYLVTQAESLNQMPVLVVCIIIYAILGIVARSGRAAPRAFGDAVAASHWPSGEPGAPP